MKKENILIVFFVVLILGALIFVTFQFNKEEDPKGSQEQTQIINMKQLQKPSMQIDISKAYVAILKTSEGEIELELNAKQTPNTVNNFVYLAKQKYYNNTIFHRVIKGFMIQGGDPNGDGTGGPGYRFEDEKFEGEYTRGTVAMANAGPNTNGSQFFIMHADYNLPKNYVIFGKVTQGLDVIDKIANAKVEANTYGEQSKPVSPVKVLSVEITEK
jgi:cyclophilin family peptidyl-prolyl cis-trans isomerase